WSQSHSVWTLIPFTSHVAGVENNPYILQFNPTPDRKARCIADTIENHKDSLHLIYVKADHKPSPEVAHLLQELNERNIHVDTVPLHAMLNDSADSIASDTLTNLVILHTDNYSNASVIIPHVKQLAIRHDVRLLAQDSWMQQADILPLRPVYAYFFLQSDNNSSAANIYNRIHNYYFSSGSSYSPAVNYPRFDLLGYDLTSYLLYLLPSLYEHNNNLDTDINPDYIFYEPFTTGIQSNIHFVRTNADGGWINEYIQVAY
nr:hypothetical protein [Paludibacteraceae bacterium]